MYKSTAVNVITIIAAVFLAISLACLGTTTVSSYVVSSIFTPDTVVKMFQSNEYEDMLNADAITDSFSDEYEFDDDIVDDLIQSSVFEDILSDISEGMFDALSGKGGDEIVSEKDIRKYIKKNIDEIVDIIDDNIETDLSKAEIEDEILANVDDIAYEISENCPTADEIAEEIDPGMRAVFSFITGGTLLLICIIFTLIVAVGLYFLRFKYLRGFIWVGSSGLAVSIFSFISGLSSSLIVALLEGEVYYEADLAFINSFIDIISGKFIFAGAIVGVVSLILLLVGIIVGNILKKKSKEKILRTAVPNATIPN